MGSGITIHRGELAEVVADVADGEASGSGDARNAGELARGLTARSGRAESDHFAPFQRSAKAVEAPKTALPTAMQLTALVQETPRS